MTFVVLLLKLWVAAFSFNCFLRPSAAMLSLFVCIVDDTIVSALLLLCVCWFIVAVCFNQGRHDVLDLLGRQALVVDDDDGVRALVLTTGRAWFMFCCLLLCCFTMLLLVAAGCVFYAFGGGMVHVSLGKPGGQLRYRTKSLSAGSTSWLLKLLI